MIPLMQAVRARDASAEDAGFTLVELLTAMAVFAVLMLIVGAATLSGFSDIRNVNTRANAQQETQNAQEWVLRLMGYTVIPPKETVAITEATPTSVTFYTYAGVGQIRMQGQDRVDAVPLNDVPYKARIYTVLESPDGTDPGDLTPPAPVRKVISEVWTPHKIAFGGGWKWDWPDNDANRSRRVLLTLPQSAGVPLNFKYYTCDKYDCYNTRGPVAPTGGQLIPPSIEVPESIEVTIGDPNEPASLLNQTIRLVNLT
jgi:prepilin-type N-terminal cleavage/methylation domain-containing protein